MKFRSFLAIFAVLALVLGACSDDDPAEVSTNSDSSEDSDGNDADEDTDADSDEESDDNADDESDEDADADSEDESEEDSDDESEDDSDPFGDLEDFEDLEDLDEVLGDFDGILGGDCMEFSLAYAGIFMAGLTALGGDTDELEAAMDDLEDLGASVPAEVEDEFAIVSEAYIAYYEEMGEMTMSEWGELEDPMSDPDVVEADAAITDYLEEACSEFG